MTKTLPKNQNKITRYKFLDLFVDDFDISQINQIYKGSHITNLNLEQVVLAAEDKELKEIIVNSELIIPDGEAVVFAFNYLLKDTQNTQSARDFGVAKPRLKKLAGIELAQKLLESKNKIAIFGSTNEVINKIKKRFAKKIVFAHHGYLNVGKKDEIEKIAKQIQESKAELLLVGMGAPLQEKFINDNKKYFSEIISMGVGGSLDVFAGKAFRAPQWMIKLKLEWFFRIFQEPSRLKRIFTSVPKFFALIFFPR